MKNSIITKFLSLIGVGSVVYLMVYSYFYNGAIQSWRRDKLLNLRMKTTSVTVNIIEQETNNSFTNTTTNVMHVKRTMNITLHMSNITAQQSDDSLTNSTGNEKPYKYTAKRVHAGDIMEKQANNSLRGKTKQKTKNSTQIFSKFARGNPFTIKGENMTVHRIPRQKTCAVVGNSGILLNSSCGDEINSNDFVIRCNIPEIEGFSRDVGNKTNVTNINLTRVKDIHKYAKKNSDSPNFIDNFRYLNNTILWTLGSPRTARTKKLVYSVKYLKSKFDLNFQVAYTEVEQN